MRWTESLKNDKKCMPIYVFEVKEVYELRTGIWTAVSTATKLYMNCVQMLWSHIL